MLLKQFRNFFYYADASTWTWGDASYGLLHILDTTRTYEVKAREIHQEAKNVRGMITDQCLQVGLICNRHKTNYCKLLELKKYGGCA